MSDIPTPATEPAPATEAPTEPAPPAPTTPVTGEPPAPAPASADSSPPPAPAQANDIASMEAALKKANKEAETARLKLKEIEDQGKSELERLVEANAELQLAASDHAKLKVAMAKAPPGTTQEQILALYPRLQGNNPEELEADAEALFAQFPTAPPTGTPTQSTPGLPVETLQPGAPQVGNGPGLPEQIRAAEEAGDWSTARRLKSQMTIEAMENRPS